MKQLILRFPSFAVLINQRHGAVVCLSLAAKTPRQTRSGPARPGPAQLGSGSRVHRSTDDDLQHSSTADGRFDKRPALPSKQLADALIAFCRYHVSNSNSSYVMKSTCAC